MRDEKTLGGYFDLHERPPAFEGKDGKAYSVSILLSDDPGPEGYGAALMYLRWSDQGDAPVGHVETDYLFFAASAVEVEALLCDLSLHDVKEHLDIAIDCASERAEW